MTETTKRMSAELRDRLQGLVKSQSKLKLSFLVTMVPGAAWRGVAPFEPTLDIESARLVAGEMTPEQALALAKRKEVERIEFDGEAHTLPEVK
jgi:hypothetical protein